MSPVIKVDRIAEKKFKAWYAIWRKEVWIMNSMRDNAESAFNAGYLAGMCRRGKALPRFKSKNPKLGKTVHTDLERLKYKEI